MLMKSRQLPTRKIQDAHVLDMLMVCRDSSENNHFLVKGLNLGFRECPYVLLINLVELESRFDNALSSKEREHFKSILNSIGSDMLGSVILLEVFFGGEILTRKLPIIMRICTVLRDHQGSPNDHKGMRSQFAKVLTE